jgi:hypothetical protein
MFYIDMYTLATKGWDLSVSKQKRTGSCDYIHVIKWPEDDHLVVETCSPVTRFNKNTNKWLC